MTFLSHFDESTEAGIVFRLLFVLNDEEDIGVWNFVHRKESTINK